MEQETVDQSESTKRWKMNRVGILNFWFYDEEEFQLEDGRMILRGANGSGKSVTMQSFLPLVLDGDKRPHRLDPFGSRDRRIEYYLLGETDSGKSDVTGYLWMEFIHPEKCIYKTIGIGLRARRGAAQVQFWGFVIEDGRRIGKDIWLYDRNYWLEQSVRVPLGKGEWTEKVGEGGQVVTEQRAYRDLVNKQMFGFTDMESFQDLLHLMIQLRSPKLSKDFKPSAIYEILHQALPPLQEEELRPLSEVLEDMDQITDRLDEIRTHRKEMSKLQDVYDRYNKQTLYIKSTVLLTKNSDYEEVNRKVLGARHLLEQAKNEQSTSIEEKEAIENRIQDAEAELEVLQNHEALGKQSELEAVSKASKEAQKYLAQTTDRMNKSRTKKDRLEQQQRELKENDQSLRREQTNLLQELESRAQEIEFTDHSVYHQYWDRDLPQDDSWRQMWKRDLMQHREQLEHALEKARNAREAEQLLRELERDLGEARKKRDEAEHDRSCEERELEAAKERYKEDIMRWRAQLELLMIHEDQVSEIFGAVTQFDGEGSESVRHAVNEAYNEFRENVTQHQLKLKNDKETSETEKEHIENELQEWEQSREPEPDRNEKRSRARLDRGKGNGAPLYSVCDFSPHLNDTEKAYIEEALDQAGLLDAWITPDGHIGQVSEEQEEFWLIPQPHEIGYTLADVLRPAIPDESGLHMEMVDAVLRTFLWDESGDVTEYEAASGVLSPSGHFRLGPLIGKSGKKERAEFIGSETRKQTRQLRIIQLKQDISLVDGQIQAAEQSILDGEEQLETLKRDADSFPNTASIQEKHQSLQRAVYRLEATIDHEQHVQKRFSTKSSEWRELQRQFTELTASWSRLKNETELNQAIRLSREYETAIGELHSVWRRVMDLMSASVRTEIELEELVEELVDDESTAEDLEERTRTLRSQEAALRKTIEDMGLTDIIQKIESLKEERDGLKQKVKEISKAIDGAKDQVSRLSERLTMMGERLSELEAEVNRSAKALHREWSRKLLLEWREIYESDLDMQKTISLCRDISGQYKTQFAHRNPETLKNDLLEQFNAVRIILTEYVLETEIEEDTGRILIYSKRDRTRPQPPAILLEELQRSEDEQSILLSEKDRQLYEEIILRSVGKAIRQRIHRAESWVKQMNRLMEERNTSSGLRLKLAWEPKAAGNEQQMDTSILVELLKRDSHRLREEEIDQMINHFRSHIGYAKRTAQEEQESLRQHLYEVLDYRNWFQFELRYQKGGQAGYRPLTDSRFNVLSGGEKAMAMYIPLFAATWSRYADARPDAPRMISLDEAFAGVDDENMRDMFMLLTDMGFDYMMTSQVLWGCYDTVPSLSIYEIYRPKDVDFVTLFRYRWNGQYKEYVESGERDDS